MPFIGGEYAIKSDSGLGGAISVASVGIMYSIPDDRTSVYRACLGFDRADLSANPLVGGNFNRRHDLRQIEKGSFTPVPNSEVGRPITRLPSAGPRNDPVLPNKVKTNQRGEN